MPDDLKPQVPYLKKLTTLLGLSQVEKEGFEADDVIGTLAMLGVKNNVQVVIVSGDKDFAQLVRPGISLYDTMKDLRTDDDCVKAKFGVRPDQIIDYLAMCGDASDNVPGVRGIGPKGAAKLLSDYQTLDGIYDHIGEIKGATQKKLIEGKESAYLSQKLCTIVSDVSLDVNFDDLKVRPVEEQGLRAMLQELGFGSFERKFFAAATSETPAAAPSVAVTVEKPKARKTPSAPKAKLGRRRVDGGRPRRQSGALLGDVGPLERTRSLPRLQRQSPTCGCERCGNRRGPRA